MREGSGMHLRFLPTNITTGTGTKLRITKQKTTTPQTCSTSKEKLVSRFGFELRKRREPRGTQSVTQVTQVLENLSVGT
jgi:hypothetical protein